MKSSANGEPAGRRERREFSADGLVARQFDVNGVRSDWDTRDRRASVCR